MNAAVDIPANPRKTKALLRLGAVDIAALKARTLALTDATWAFEDSRKPNRKFTSLDRTEHIVFRFIRNSNDWRHSDDYPLWESWKDVLQPVLSAATRSYEYARAAYPRIMLARMPVGGVIKPHQDLNPSARWPHKIHVPITTNENVRFFIDPETYHLETGQAYEVNNLCTHAVENAGDSARIHLIFEYFDVDQPVTP